jgi:hypothetical protein
MKLMVILITPPIIPIEVNHPHIGEGTFRGLIQISLKLVLKFGQKDDGSQ